MLNTPFIKRLLICTATLVICAEIPYSAAQEIEEVVIQAELNSNESLDDLVSVSALSGEKLADAGIGNVEDVAAYVPNLVLTETDTGTNIVIRGIGAGVNQGFDQSVGLYIDGVPLPRSQMARAPFLDLSGVQVLRGPQYVKDGNYSIAGSVHMLTNDSSEEFEGAADFNFIPSQDDKKLLLTVGLPLTDSLGMRISLQSSKSDGYIENVTRKENGPQRDELIGRMVFNFQPLDELSFKLKLEKGSFDSKGRQIEIIQSEAVPDIRLLNTHVNDVPGRGLRSRGTLAQFGGSSGPAKCQPGHPDNTSNCTINYQNEYDYIYYPHRIIYDAGQFDNPFTGADLNSEFYFIGESYLGLLAKLHTIPADGSGLAPVPIPVGLLDSQINFKRGADLEEYSNNDSLNLTLNTEYWIDEHHLKLVASYVEYQVEEQIDSDFTAAPILKSNQSEDYEQRFFRIDYKSPEGGFIELEAGLSFLDSKLTFSENVTPIVPQQIDFDISDISNLQAFTDYGNSVYALNPLYPLEAFFGRISTGTSFGWQASRAFRALIPFRKFEQEAKTTAAFINLRSYWSDTFRSTIGVRYTHSLKEAVRDLALLKPDGTPLTDADNNNPSNGVAASEVAEDAYNSYVLFFGLGVHTDIPGTEYNVVGLDYDALKGKRREEKLLPSLSLEWDLSEDLTILASARMANKLGGYDARSNSVPNPIPGRGLIPGSFEFEDEDAVTYEFGAKWFMPDGWGQINTTIFFTKFKNLQNSAFDGKTGFNVVNAGAAETLGVEIEGNLQASDALNITYSLAWIDFTFTDFPVAPCHISRRPDYFRVGVPPTNLKDQLSIGDLVPIAYDIHLPLSNTGQNFGQATTALSQGADSIAPKYSWFINPQKFAAACDFKGHTNQYVAEWQSTVSFNYEVNVVSLGSLKPTIDILYNSGYHTTSTQDPDAYQDGYFQLNGRLALASFEDIWEVALTAKNLTNQKIVTYANEVPFAVRTMGSKTHYGFVRSSRAIGINLRYNFY